MTVVALIPALVCTVGLVIWALVARKAVVGEAGKLMFGCGLLVWLLVLARHIVKL